MLIKITDLEEKMLEAQLQIERLTDEKLTHMLSVQKSPIDKIGLGYVTSTSDIPSTSKTVFVMPTVPELPPACMDKGKALIGEDDSVVAESTQKPPTMRGPPICHHCVMNGHVRPKCPLLKAQRSKIKKEPPRQATSGRISGSTASTAIATIYSCQLEWQTKEEQIMALEKEASEA